MRPEAGPWWRQAQADHDAARQNMRLGLHFVVVWLVQQSAEKALKALWIDRQGVEAPRTHDLDYLGQQLNVPTAVASDLSVLTPLITAVRYPDDSTGVAPVDAVGGAAAATALMTLERVIEWIRNELRA